MGRLALRGRLYQRGVYQRGAHPKREECSRRPSHAADAVASLQSRGGMARGARNRSAKGSTDHSDGNEVRGRGRGETQMETYAVYERIVSFESERGPRPVADEGARREVHDSNSMIRRACRL